MPPYLLHVEVEREPLDDDILTVLSQQLGEHAVVRHRLRRDPLATTGYTVDLVIDAPDAAVGMESALTQLAAAAAAAGLPADPVVVINAAGKSDHHAEEVAERPQSALK